MNTPAPKPADTNPTLPSVTAYPDDALLIQSPIQIPSAASPVSDINTVDPIPEPNPMDPFPVVDPTPEPEKIIPIADPKPTPMIAAKGSDDLMSKPQATTVLGAN